MIAPLVLLPQHFGCLVFDRRTSRYSPFDHECTGLLRALVGRTIDEVLSVHTHPEAVRAFHQHLAAAGFFTLDGRFAGEVRELEPPADHLAGPLALHLEITDACDLSCEHCFAGDRDPATGDPLTVEEIDALCGELDRLGCFRLGLTGGEPLLLPQLFEIVDCALDHGLHPCITTNGLSVDERRTARELGRRELAWLNVSLEGATRQTNDAVCGAGTFDRVMEGLRRLRAHTRFTLAFAARDSPSRPFAYDTKPVVAISWGACQALGRRLSTGPVEYRLPTEEEWERAARGGLTGARHPWGDAPPTPLRGTVFFRDELPVEVVGRRGAADPARGGIQGPGCSASRGQPGDGFGPGSGSLPQARGPPVDDRQGGGASAAWPPRSVLPGAGLPVGPGPPREALYGPWLLLPSGEALCGSGLPRR